MQVIATTVAAATIQSTLCQGRGVQQTSRIMQYGTVSSTRQRNLLRLDAG
jgi:hypothetical protein